MSAYWELEEPKGPKEVLAVSPARWPQKKMPVLSVQKINKDDDLVKRLKVPREYRGTSLITSNSPVGPYGRLCLGPYGGPRGGEGASYERGTPVKRLRVSRG